MRFGFEDIAEILRGLAAERGLEADPDRGGFRTGDGEAVRLPLVCPLGGARSLDEYLAAIPSRLGLHLVVLIRAGASALGLFEEGVPIRHKVIKKYVTRGKGKAQPSHLKTKGKSRYGSRLRLQNWQRQLEQTNEKLREWAAAHPEPERKFYSCPVRSWPELWTTRPEPPYERGSFEKIPLHVHQPGFEELERVYRALGTGEVLRLR